jgi:hypothetical protein
MKTEYIVIGVIIIVIIVLLYKKNDTVENTTQRIPYKINTYSNNNHQQQQQYQQQYTNDWYEADTCGPTIDVGADYRGCTNRLVLETANRGGNAGFNQPNMIEGFLVTEEVSGVFMPEDKYSFMNHPVAGKLIFKREVADESLFQSKKGSDEEQHDNPSNGFAPIKPSNGNNNPSNGFAPIKPSNGNNNPSNGFAPIKPSNGNDNPSNGFASIAPSKGYPSYPTTNHDNTPIQRQPSTDGNPFADHPEEKPKFDIEMAKKLTDEMYDNCVQTNDHAICNRIFKPELNLPIPYEVDSDCSRACQNIVPGIIPSYLMDNPEVSQYMKDFGQRACAETCSKNESIYDLTKFTEGTGQCQQQCDKMFGSWSFNNGNTKDEELYSECMNVTCKNN